MKYIYIIITILLSHLLPVCNAIGQELIITGLYENPKIINFLNNNPSFFLKNKAATDTLTLPFFDDFAKNDIYPDNKLWLDKDVFINTSFGDNPPSIGVATFDAIDSSGYVYGSANSNSFIGDYLTSKPINLDGFTASDSIYLSFFYQAQGFAGNFPESKDSLVLEFKDTSSVWHSVWRVQGSVNSDFKQVLIPVTNEMFLHSGFQFSFKNYASLGDPVELSWHSNCDIWNIDYVYMDTNRTYIDTVYDDVSLVYPVESPLNNYNAMPWTHYKQDSSEMTGSMTIIVKNLYNVLKPFISLYSITNILETNTGTELQYGSDNVDVNSTFSISKTGFGFSTTSSDSALFEIKTYLQADTSDPFPDFHWNDTAVYYQKFYNYYAYDDGTPEYGLGLYGDGSENGMFAMMYYTYQPDTLRALQIFFNHTKEEVNFRYFYMNVWDNNNGYPGNIIYSQMGVKAKYNGFNKFENYLFDTVLVVSDTFFIGWQKTNTIEMMNVGLDLSVDNKNKTFYTFNGTQWNTSPYDGTIMLRPVFGKDISTVNTNTIIKNTKNLKIFPNPANNIINVEVPDIAQGQVFIYDNMGKQVYSADKIIKKINIENLKQGIYFIKIVTTQNNYLQGKFMKIR